MYANAGICWDIYTRAPNGRAMDSSVALVGAARERRANPLAARERFATALIAAGFLVAAAATLVLVPWEPDADLLLMAALVVFYAVASRIEFEFGNGSTNPEQLVFVPMLFLAPLALVPLLVAAGFTLGRIRERIGRKDHALSDLAGTWFTITPVWVLATLAPSGPPTLDAIDIYLLALTAMIVTATGMAVVQQWLANDLQPVWPMLWAWRVDIALVPIGFIVAFEGARSPLIILLTITPLLWLFRVFSQERKERYNASLELQSAYRGTVMLLSDVVEAEDDYTAFHCRSVVELVAEVADEMKIPKADRQELEFAALLHDVGKIAIPKEILNKPAKLTDEEFELIKTHTLEGQQLLDRVGGLMGRVGKIVRSCHERWDGRGYPDGLMGQDIPLAARIVFCCDAYNAMTTDRPYRKAMRREDALAEIRDNAGSQFDPTVAAALEHVVLSDERYPRLIESVASSHAIAAATLATRRQAAPTVEREQPAAAAG
jgi:HD-GYP domain-containing protein (c-di-GMP phosphodiesterase class II)